MCFLCSGEPVHKDEMKGRYGEAYAKYADNQTTFDVSLLKTPCAEPCCWIGSMAFLPCAAVKMRHRALNHVEPGSGWSNYLCCQGFIPGCCCIKPGELGEKSCPCLCMTCEALCCPGCAVSSTSYLIRDHHSLGLDEDDYRVIQCNNCIQCFREIFNLISCLVDFEGEEEISCAVNTVADVVFCCISGCMTAQVYHEIKIRESGSAPTSETIERY